MRNIALQDASGDTSAAALRDRPRSSDRVLQLLFVVATSANGLSLTEAAARVGLVPSTALRQLRSLEAAGLLDRDNEDQIYRPGSRLIELSRTVFVGQSLARDAQPFLDQLSDLTGESAYLAVAESTTSAVYVAAAPGHHALRHSGWLGRGFRSSSTAVGAALIGRVDPDGVISREGKLEPGITAVTAPLRSRSAIVAAISVVGPSFRLTGARLRDARRAVGASAVALSTTLGYSAEPTA